MKKLFFRLTLASFLTLLIYFVANALITAFLNELSVIIALIILVVLIMVLYVFIVIYLTYIRTGLGEETLWNDYPDTYKGTAFDFKVVFREEQKTFLIIFAIDMASWVLTGIDKLIFGKTTITAILLVYAPLNIVGIMLPSWLNGILGYLVGALLVSGIYLLALVMLRRKWYKQYKG